MKITYKHILILLIGYLLYNLYQNIKLIDIRIKKKLIEKVVSSDKSGRPYCYYKWLNQNGEIEVTWEDFSSSANYEVGKTYIFKEHTLDFK